MKDKDAVMKQLRFMFGSCIIMSDNRDTLKMSLQDVEEYMMEKYDDYYEWLMEE
jgi:hypothetical protein